MRFEVYEAFHSGPSNGVDWEFKSAGWYWRLRARNGRIVADGSEAYSSKAKAERAINRLFGRILTLGHRPPIVETEQ